VCEAPAAEARDLLLYDALMDMLGEIVSEAQQEEVIRFKLTDRHRAEIEELDTVGFTLFDPTYLFPVAVSARGERAVLVQRLLP
jgi:hypothetical protein